VIRRAPLVALAAALFVAPGCLSNFGTQNDHLDDAGDDAADGGDGDCGPATGTVARAIDGDTLELIGGERVRLILVNTPETSGDSPDCFGPEAFEFTQALTEGQEVELTYDAECRDQFDRLLAYVVLADDGTDVDATLVREGYACVLHIPPNGNDRVEEFYGYLDEARDADKGMWGACTNPCG
jgi:micrococcal nuclease